MDRTWQRPLSDPGCAKTFFLPQKLYATGDDPHRHDGLSIFLLCRVRSQAGRKVTWAIVTVFDDSQGAMNYFMQEAKKFTGQFSQFQLREIMAELAFLNLHLKERPIFKSDCERDARGLHHCCHATSVDLSPLDPNVRGRLLQHHVLRDAIPVIRVPGHTQKK